MKDILEGDKGSLVKKNEGFCGPCKKSTCTICEHIVRTDSFKSKTTQQTYFIKLENLRSSCENVVYLLTYKTCSKNIHGVQKIFDQGLITIDVLTETF